ncbi:MAG: alternative ribosome rescue aminoacyl-tRNA hydrolase ArfB [bacterium]
MMSGSLKTRSFEKEFIVQTARSSGPGGQKVNKTESKVELRFHVDNSQLLSNEEKEKVKEKLKHKINNEGFLQVFAQEHRSQLKNKELAEKRFYLYLGKALQVKKKRIQTNPTKSSKEKRIQNKKKTSEKKKLRSNKLFQKKLPPT